MPNCYYTFIESDGVFLVWQPGQPPSMLLGPMTFSEHDAMMREHFAVNVMTYVPSEVVQRLSSS